jgi:hypothetical protein
MSIIYIASQGAIKTFSISKNTAAVDILLLKFKVTWSISLMYWSVMLWQSQNPNWLALSGLLLQCAFGLHIFRITFLNNFPFVDKGLIGRKFWGNFGSLPGFGNIINFTSFQGFGKWNSRRQWLNKCVRCTSGVLGRFLRHSFGILPSSQAFHNFNEYANLCMSQGFTFPSGVPSTDASRAWTVGSTCHSWFSSHRSRVMNWFSEQCAITLAFLFI